MQNYGQCHKFVHVMHSRIVLQNNHSCNFIRIFPTIHCGIHAWAWCALECVKPYSRAEWIAY